jgi:hypothetical protein
MAYDGQIRIDSKIDSKGFNSGVKGMLGKLAPLAAAGAVLFGTVFGTKALLAVSKLSAEFQRMAIAAQAVGQLNGIAAVQTRALVKELVDMGIQTDVANRSFIEFVRGGLDTGLIKSLARASQDLAVFAGEGQSSSEVFDSLLHGITTLNPTVLRTAGIIVDLDTAYREFTKDAGKSVDALSGQEKQQAALNAVLQQSTKFNGLYELSQKTVAGQLSSSTRIMNELKAAIGAPFQDALFQLIKSWNGLAKAFAVALQPGGRLYAMFVRIGAVASVLAGIIARLFNALAALFGVNSQLGTAGAKSMNEQVGELAESSNDAADAQDNLAGSTTKAAKAAKGALASFDQLNVLQQDTGGAGGAGTPDLGGALGGLGEIDASKFTDPLEAIRVKAEELEDKFRDFFAPIIDGLGKLAEAARPLGDTIWSGLQWAWENILKPLGEWAAQTLVPAVFDLFAAAAGALNEVLITLAPLAQNFYDNFLKPVGEFVGDKVIEFLGWLTEKLYELADWIKENPEKFQEFAKTVIALGVAFFLFSRILAAVMLVSTLLSIIIPAVSAAFAFLLSPIGLAIVGIIALIAAIVILIAHWDDVKKFAVETWETIKQAWAIAGWWFQTTVIDPIGDAFDTVLANIKLSFETTFNIIKLIVKNAINGVIDAINRALSGVTSAINTFSQIGAYVGLNIPQAVAPQIPHLATGAVIPPNAQFAAILGDQTSGRNIEAPEKLIRQIIQEEIGNVKADININFDGSMGELVRLLKPRIDRENVRIGRSLAKGTA